MHSDSFNVLLHFYGFQEKCAYWSVDNRYVRFLHSLYHCYVGRNIIFGIATSYGLDGPGIESR